MTTPPRHWFQIHLSTAFILMLSTAGLLGLQLHGLYFTWNDSDNTAIDIYGGGWYEWDYGWPLAHSRIVTYDYFTSSQLKHFHWPGLIVDALCALLFLAVLAVLCEHWIRCREAIKK